MKLGISKDLKLSVEAVTESIALLAKRGAGKTYAASVLVEEMLKAKLQVVVLDPMGAWWGLRSSADGSESGFPIAILGGDHGDVPLEPTGGVLVADLVVDERLSVILDLSPFSKTQRRQFVADFLERLYQRNREAMHVVLEEADLFAPEGKLKRAGDEAMLGAVYDLVRRGRGRGIGSTLITQRSASLSKEVLTQAEILIALRTTGPQDVAAIREWIRYHGSDEERELVLSSLHELPTGEAFAWWPVEGILKRIRIRARETFDSSATPKPGQARSEPKTVADVDLEALSERMRKTIERAKAEDPRELRKRIADLERRLRERSPETVIERVEVPIEIPTIDEEQLELLTSIVGELRDTATTVGALRAVADQIDEGLRRASTKRPERRVEDPQQVMTATSPRATRPQPAAIPDRDGHVDNGALAAGHRKILNALAWLETISYREGSRVQVAFLAGYSPKAGHFQNLLGNLHTHGYVHYPFSGFVSLTDKGQSVAEYPDAPGSAEELQHAVLAKLNGGQQKLLQALLVAYPKSLTRDELAEQAGYSPNAGHFQNLLGSLRSLGLIDYPRPGYVVALDVLFPEISFA